MFNLTWPDLFIRTVALVSFVGGYLLKGTVTAYMADVVFRPLARRIKRNTEHWEDDHPLRFRWFYHFLDNHKGHKPSYCLHPRCMLAEARHGAKKLSKSER